MGFGKWDAQQSDGFANALNGKAASSHNHAASEIASGTIATARLGSGTANSTTYLRGDQTWATVSAGVGGSTGATDERILRADGTGGATAQGSLLTLNDQGGLVANFATGSVASLSPVYVTETHSQS